MWTSTDEKSVSDFESSNETKNEIETLGLVAKFRKKLFASRPPSASSGLVVLSKRDISLSRTAELLLISRLKARSPCIQTAGMLERAAHIVFVTCKNWFSDSEPQRAPRRHTSI